MPAPAKTSHEPLSLIVIGGGPAGAILASAVALRGHKVLLLEKESFPRYQIGESLLPSTMRVCSLVGALDEIDKAGFNPKTGGTWFWGERPSWGFTFAEGGPPAVGAEWSYQVERMRFDKIMLDNARRVGVDVREQHTVEGLIEEAGRVVGVNFTDPDGHRHTARARFTISAGGHSSPFYRAVGERIMAPRFRHVALFCYYRGGFRNPPPLAGNIFNITFPGGWFWYIPLSDTLTSVGAIISIADAGKLKAGHEQAMESFIESSQVMKGYLSGATRITEGPYGQYRVRKDWSYCNTRFWKPGMALVGDAACFVDPLFSTGVHLAAYSGLLAARSVNSVLEGGLAEEPAFAEFELRYRSEYAMIYKFLSEFYDVSRTKEEFWAEAHSLLPEGNTDKEAFVRLVAGFGSGDVATNGQGVPSTSVSLPGRETDDSRPSGANAVVPSDDGLSWTAAIQSRR